MLINTIYFITNKIKSKKCECKIQLYGKINVHSFSNTLEDIKLDQIYHKTKTISLFSYVKSCSGVHVHVNLVAGISARTVDHGNTMSLNIILREVVPLVENFCFKFIKCGRNSPCSPCTAV